ncbi:hypothetical protein [Cereibacter sphaeroides]|uniref:hypothetical protein n=1 Tax=Cereibacter sphaeroides TaxID=1063 RepID=UPI000309E5B0
MQTRIYIAGHFAGHSRSYTYHDDTGTGAQAGDVVQVSSRGRRSELFVTAVTTERPPFETKQIDKLLRKGGAA